MMRKYIPVRSVRRVRTSRVIIRFGTEKRKIESLVEDRKTGAEQLV